MSLVLNSTAAQIPSREHLSAFEQPIAARCINALWFLSLSVSLSAALLAILVKQWLGEYTSRMRMRVHSASQRHWAWRHIVYHSGLVRWGMDGFISALPLLLHVSLFLFMAGLVLFLVQVDWILAGLVLLVTTSLVAFYIAATFAPLWIGDCPTGTPLLRRSRRLLEVCVLYFRRRLVATGFPLGRRLKYSAWSPAAYEEAALITDRDASKRDIEILRWMVAELPVVTEADVALEAIGSLDVLQHQAFTRRGTAPVDLQLAITERFGRLASYVGQASPEDIGRCLRTLIFLGVDKWTMLRVPVSAREALQKWREIRTFDVHVLWDAMFSFRGFFEETTDDLVGWAVDERKADNALPFLPSSLSLIFLRPEVPLPVVSRLVQAFCHIVGPLAAPSTALPQCRTAFILLANCIQREAVPETLSQLLIGGPKEQLSRPEQLHIRALHLLGSIMTAPSTSPLAIDVQKLAAERYGDLASYLADNIAGVSATEVHQHMSHIATSEFALCDAELVQPVLSSVAMMLRAEHIRAHWSKQLGQMAENVIKHLVHLNRGDEATALISGIAGYADCTGIVGHLSANHISAVDGLQGCILNLLQPSTLRPGEPSCWATLWQVEAHLWKMNHLGQFATSCAVHLCVLSRSGADVRAAAMVLLYDDYCFRLIIDYPGDRALELARHAKELSKEWWARTRLELLEVGDNDWDGRFSEYSTPGDFVEVVDRLGACDVCPSTLAFARHSDEALSDELVLYSA